MKKNDFPCTVYIANTNSVTLITDELSVTTVILLVLQKLIIPSLVTKL